MLDRSQAERTERYSKEDWRWFSAAKAVLAVLEQKEHKDQDLGPRREGERLEDYLVRRALAKTGARKTPE